MMAGRCLLVGALVAQSALAGRAGGQERPDVFLRAAIEASGRWTDYTCRTRTEVVTRAGVIASAGEMSYLRPGYLKTTSSKLDGAGEFNQTRTFTDGKITFIEATVGRGEPPVVIKNAESGTGPGTAGAASAPSDMLAQMSQLFSLRFAEGQEGSRIEGELVIVLEGPYRQGSLARLIGPPPEGADVGPLVTYIQLMESSMGSIRLAIGARDSFLYQMELKPPPKPLAKALDSEPDPAEVLKTTTTFYAVRINGGLRPADFEYTPPPGAEVLDLIEMKLDEIPAEARRPRFGAPILPPIR